MPQAHDGSGDPAIVALTQLLQSEREQALTEEPSLVERCDPGRVWLLWFAIGATEEVCTLLQRESDGERSQVFRGVVSTIFGRGVHSDVDPVVADKCLIDRFESAGAEAIRACMRGDEGLGHYLTALRRSGGYHC